MKKIIILIFVTISLYSCNNKKELYEESNVLTNQIHSYQELITERINNYTDYANQMTQLQINHLNNELILVRMGKHVKNEIVLKYDLEQMIDTCSFIKKLEKDIQKDQKRLIQIDSILNIK